MLAFLSLLTCTCRCCITNTYMYTHVFSQPTQVSVDQRGLGDSCFNESPTFTIYSTCVSVCMCTCVCVCTTEFLFHIHIHVHCTSYSKIHYNALISFIYFIQSTVLSICHCTMFIVRCTYCYSVTYVHV